MLVCVGCTLVVSMTSDTFADPFLLEQACSVSENYDTDSVKASKAT